MRMPWYAGALLAALALTGCNRSPEPVVHETPKSHLGTTSNVDLAAWLAEPRAAQADQVRQLRSVGVDAWAWLPTSKDAADLADYAERQGATLVLVPPDLEEPGLVDRVVGRSGAAEADQASRVPFEVVGER